MLWVWVGGVGVERENSEEEFEARLLKSGVRRHRANRAHGIASAASEPRVRGIDLTARGIGRAVVASGTRAAAAAASSRALLGARGIERNARSSAPMRRVARTPASVFQFFLSCHEI